MENKEDQDGMRELRAYKVGYDLGFFRGVESMTVKIQEIAGAIEHSATWKKIVDEAKEKGDDKLPWMFQDLLATIMDASTLKNELMPTLLVEKRAINDLGKRIQALPPDAFTGEKLVLDFEKPVVLEEGEKNGQHIKGFSIWDDETVVPSGSKGKKGSGKAKSTSKTQQKTKAAKSAKKE